MEYTNKNRDYTVSREGLNGFMMRVFGWMFCGLLLTAGAAYALAVMMYVSPAALSVASSPIFLFALIIIEFVLVFRLSRSINKISEVSAKLMFMLYSVVNGFTMSYIFLLYGGALVGQAFIYAAIFFGVMGLYGFFTKTDLSSMSKVFTVGLISIIIASVINIFMGSSGFDFIICVIGLGLFVGLTAYDMQKIKNHFYEAALVSGEEMASKIAILGALELYLDFVNMFLYILRLLGRKR